MHSETYQQRSFQRGFTLIELMISMVIGLIVLSGVIAVFSNNNKSFNLNEELSAMQENARFAMDLLTSDTRVSGLQGCINIEYGSAEILSNSAPTSDYLLTATRGAEYNGTAWNPSRPTELNGLDPAPISNSDILMLQFGSLEQSRLAATGMNSASNAITLVDNNADLKKDDLAIISDCLTADIFTVTSVSANSGSTLIGHQASSNTSGSLTRAYENDGNSATDMARVMKFNYNTYYIGDSGRTNKAEDAIYSLYRYDIDAINGDEKSIELIEGVENMQLLFGIIENNNNLRYISSNHIAFDPAKIHSVQIALLMQSIESIADNVDEKSYRLLSELITADSTTAAGVTHKKDRRMRMVFNTTVNVRNRR